MIEADLAGLAGSERKRGLAGVPPWAQPTGGDTSAMDSSIRETTNTGSGAGIGARSADEDHADSAASFKTLLESLRRSEGWEQLPFSRRLRRIRKARDWSHQQLARRMVLVGRNHRGRTASAESLVKMLSRWENDDRLADDRNRRLLADALEVEVADLGLTVDPDVIW